MAETPDPIPVPVSAAIPSAAPPDEALLLDSRRNNFDFLRFLFAVWVLYSHCFALVANGNRYFDISDFTRGQTYLGHIALQGFFLISGFLITMSWVRSRGLRDFLRRRVLRIYPGYLAACLFCVLLVGPLGSESARHYFAQLSLPSTVRQMATLDKLAAPPTFMNSPAPGEINGSLWSIRIEFECYLLLPLLAASGLLRRRRFVLGLTGLVFALNSLLESPLARHLARPAPETLISHTGLGLYFLLGMTVFLYRDKFSIGRMPVLISLAALCVTAIFGGFTIALPIFGTYLLFVTAFHARIPLRRFSERVDLSYGIYLYAWPVKRIILHFLGAAMNPYLLFLLALPATCLLAVGSWLLIEKPFLKMKSGRKSR